MVQAEEEARIVHLPGCKSLSARALILAAGADGESTLRGLSDSADTGHLLRALAKLGAGVENVEGVVRVQGWNGPPRAHGVELDAGEAATNLRLLLPLLAAGSTDAVLTGSAALFARPHAPLVEFLRSQGAAIEETVAAGGGPAWRIRGRGLPGGSWQAPASPSSQPLSGLLLAAAWSAPVQIRLPPDPVPSRGYLDLTLEAIRAFRGPAALQEKGGEIHVRPGAWPGREYSIPGDASAATFFLVAAILERAAVSFSPPCSPLHPEARLHRLLFDAGLLRSSGRHAAATGRLSQRPLEFDLDGAPDAGPALAVLAALLPGGAVLKNVARLRLKESDRVAGMLRLCAALGAAARLENGSLQVAGGGRRPAAARSFPCAGDHRLAMAAAIAGLAADQPQCVAKSFPRFWEEFAPWD